MGICVKIATLFHQSSPIFWAATDAQYILALVKARGPLPLSWRPELQEFLQGKSDDYYFGKRRANISYELFLY
jgi:hypothetical protein